MYPVSLSKLLKERRNDKQQNIHSSYIFTPEPELNKSVKELNNDSCLLLSCEVATILYPSFAKCFCKKKPTMLHLGVKDRTLFNP